MTAAFIGLYFLLSLAIALTAGAGAAFALAYVPALMLLRPVVGFGLPLLPQLTPSSAAIYAIILSLLTRVGEKPRFRLCLVDWVILAAPVAATVSAIETESFHVGINQFFLQAVGW